MFSIIASVGKNNEVGKGGDLCFKIKEDLKFFKEKTMGHPVVMGYKTWLSLPKKLEGRDNYIVMHNSEKFFQPDGVVDSMAKGLELRTPEDLPNDIHIITSFQDFIDAHKFDEEEFFIIGGATIYDQALPFVKKMYLTEVDAIDNDADAFFPEFEKSLFTREWLTEGSENDLTYSRVLYTRK